MAGVPVSMVPLHRPDLERHPRFHLALAADARRIELIGRRAVHSLRLVASRGIADAIQRPGQLLVDGPCARRVPPAESLLLGLLALRDMPAAERAVWRNLFDYYVFRTSGDPLAHLTPGVRWPDGRACRRTSPSNQGHTLSAP